MIRLLINLHAAVKAFFLKRFRTQEILRVYAVAHAAELKAAPINEWPLIQAQHAQQIGQIRKGRFTAGNPIYAQSPQGQITDRRSWQFPWLPSTVTRMAIPLAKMSPYNTRRMSRTPVPRRAINLVKGAVITQPWDVAPLDNVQVKDPSTQEQRIEIARKIFTHPNNVDSFQTWVEMGIEDLCCFGAFVAELRFTIDPERPLKMWNVQTESVRLFPGWSESALDYPHYAQMTGLKGERGAILFYDDQMLYIKDNPSTDNPFGLGRMEVAFTSTNYLLGIQDMSGKAGSDQIHKTWLWWEQPQADSSYQIVRRHIQNELEGQAKVSIIGGMKKPEIIEVNPVTPEDLLLEWQEMLIRMVANAFDLSAMSLGIEHDVNRAVGTVLSDRDFRSAIVPLAKRLQEAFTRKILHDKLGWYDLEFKFQSLDDPDIETKIEIYQKAYSMNATTPNQFRQAMGWKKLDSPFADLTQFEAMMVNLEASADIQNKQQSEMMQKQMDMQNQMMQQQPNIPAAPQQQEQAQFGSPGTGKPPAPNNVAKPAPAAGGGGATRPGGLPMDSKQPPAPKALKLPKFPISGSQYTAQQIAAMSLGELVAAFDKGELPSASSTVNEMDISDPTILEELSEEVREFLERKLEEEADSKKLKKPSAKWLKEWKQTQLKKSRDDSRRMQDFAKWLQKSKAANGVPTANKAQLQQALKGKPGNVNTIRTL